MSLCFYMIFLLSYIYYYFYIKEYLENIHELYIFIKSAISINCYISYIFQFLDIYYFCHQESDNFVCNKLLFIEIDFFGEWSWDLFSTNQGTSNLLIIHLRHLESQSLAVRDILIFMRHAQDLRGLQSEANQNPRNLQLDRMQQRSTQ